MPETAVAEIVVSAPIGKTFQAWTDAVSLARWFKPSKEATCEVLDFSPRPGGAWRIRVRHPGGTYVLGGTFLEVTRPSALRFTWQWIEGGPPGFSDVTRVHVRLAPEGPGTRVQVRHERLPPPLVALHRAGWQGALGQLEAVA